MFTKTYQGKNLLNKDSREIIHQSIEIKLLFMLGQIIFNLTEENLDISTKETLKIFDANNPYSSNFVICNMIYFFSRKNFDGICIKYSETIQAKEETKENTSKIITIFCDYLAKIESQETYYLIEKMIKRDLINSNITKKIYSV